MLNNKGKNDKQKKTQNKMVDIFSCGILINDQKWIDAITKLKFKKLPCTKKNASKLPCLNKVNWLYKLMFN